MSHPIRDALGLIASCGVLFGLAAPVHAATSSAATICIPEFGTDPGSLYVASVGIYNMSSAKASVTCPLARAFPVAANGFHVNVVGISERGTTTACSLYSWRHNGALIGAVSFTATNEAFWKRLTLPQSMVPAYSYQTLRCELGAGRGYAGLFSVTYH